MKAIPLLLISVSACFGSDISGVWWLKHASADGPSFPIAVQVEQCGNDLHVLKVMATPQGKRIEQLWLTVGAIHKLASVSEISVGNEIWTIGVNGELTIHEASGQRVLLERAEGVVQ